MLPMVGKWISFFSNYSFIAVNVIFIKFAFFNAGNKAFPNSGAPLGMKWMTLSVPVIKCTRDENRVGIGRPNRKISSVSSF